MQRTDFFDSISSISEETALAAVGVFLAAFLVVYIILMAWAITAYVLQSVGLMTIARRRSIPRPWMAWIPFASSWLIGSIADHADDVRKGSNMKLRRILLINLIVLYVLIEIAVIVYVFAVMSQTFQLINDPSEHGLLSYLGSLLIYTLVVFLLTIVPMVFEYIAYYKIYSSCNPRRATLLLVLSILFPVIIPFAIFALRKRDDGLYEWTAARDAATAPAGEA